MLLPLLFTLLGLLLPAAFPPANPAPTLQALYLNASNGEEWTEFSEGLPEGQLAGQLLDHEGELLLVLEGNEIYRLPAGDCVWQRIGNRPIGDKPRFQTTGLAALGDRLVATSFPEGIWISDDRGNHWRRPVLNVPNPEVMCLQFFDGKLYAGTSSGLFVSYDRGSTWFAGPGKPFPVYNLFAHGDELIVARQNGLGVVTDDAIEWTDTRTETAVSQLLSDAGTAYAITASAELFRRETNGQWTAVTAANANGFEAELRRRLRPNLPVDLPATYSTRVHYDDSRGWIALVRGGC